MCGRAIQGGGICVGSGGLHSRGCWHYPAAIAQAASAELALLTGGVLHPDEETRVIHSLVALRAEGAVFRFPWE